MVKRSGIWLYDAAGRPSNRSPAGLKIGEGHPPGTLFFNERTGVAYIRRRDMGVQALTSAAAGPTILVASSQASEALKELARPYVCDGVGDQVQIQAAIDDLPAGGGKVVLTEGPFSIANTIYIIRDDVVFEGAGMGATVLRLADGANTNVLVIVAATENRLRITLRDFMVDANGANQVDQGDRNDLTAVYVPFHVTNRIQDLHISRVLVQGTRHGEGMNLESCDRLKLRDCVLVANGLLSVLSGDGVHLGHGTDSQVSGLTSVGNDDTGLAIDGTQYALVSGCHCRSNGSNQFTFALGSTLGIFAHCTAQGGDYGFRTGKFGTGEPATSGLTISDCHVLNANIAGVLIEDHTLALLRDILYNNNTADLTLAGVTVLISRRDNCGDVTENSGTATLVNGQVAIVVAHGLDVTPAAGDIMVTPMESLGAASEFYIDTYTAANFTIHVDVNPTQDVDFAWKAVVL